MTFLLDTNVLSELRKRERADRGVRRWFESVSERELFTSTIVIGELRSGVEQKDPVSAEHLDRWLLGLETLFAEHVLPVDLIVADQWGRLNAGSPLPTSDGLIAATALVHDLTLVTRNTDDFRRTGVVLFNPFSQ